jgi:glycosyltransferase involved in cell wall biosynthesis
MKPRIVVLHGHHINESGWKVWPYLQDEFDFEFAVTATGSRPDVGAPQPSRRVRTRRDLLPRGRVFELATLLPGDRYRGLEEVIAGADIVHSVELGPWYSGQAAQLRQRSDAFKLVVSVWETIPLLDAYRRRRAREFRRATIAAADLFLPTSERSRLALLLEGVDDERIRVCLPQVDVAAFAGRERRPVDPERPLIVSPARLVWEKGHQDVLRAAALLHRGVITRPDGSTVRPRVLIISSGPERERLGLHARELGIGEHVEFRDHVPNDRMGEVFAEAACMVLASLPVWHWEEQFGMVLAEALVTGTPVITTRSGVIPDVVGDSALLVDPGDWVGMARALASGPLAVPPVVPPIAPDFADIYSPAAYAERLRAAYRSVLDDRR